MVNLIPNSGQTADITAENVTHQKIQKAAQEFEAMLLTSLWKSMSEDSKDSSEQSSTSSSFADMGLQAMSSAMAKSGGLGIGRMVLKTLEKQESLQQEQKK